MDTILTRFPLVGKGMINLLGNKSLINFKEVSRKSLTFMDTESILWRRRIQKFATNQIRFHKLWQLFIRNTSTAILKEMALAVEVFCKTIDEIYDSTNVPISDQYSPHHVAANYGSVFLCEYVIKKTGLENPPNDQGFLRLAFLPVHFAAYSKQFETVKYLMSHLENKNPATKNGLTVLHIAAMKYGEICSKVFKK